MAFGKQAEIALAKGTTVELDGSVQNFEISIETLCCYKKMLH